MQSNRDNTLEVAIYSTTDAAHYLRVPHQTLRYWIGSKSIEPIVTPAEMNPPRLSFTNLMECYMLSSMRTHYNLRLPKVRKALKTLARLFPSPHPLVDIGGVGGERICSSSQFGDGLSRWFLRPTGHSVMANVRGFATIAPKEPAGGSRTKSLTHCRSTLARPSPSARCNASGSSSVPESFSARPISSRNCFRCSEKCSFSYCGIKYFISTGRYCIADHGLCHSNWGVQNCPLI